jgi:hypothetical protein
MFNPNPLQSIAKKFRTGGLLGAQDGQDPFNEYTVLLTSSRLAKDLASEPHFLQLLFPDQWDSRAMRWRPNNSMMDGLRRTLHRQIKTAPDADDIAKYLEHHLTSTLSLETGFATVTFDFRDRAEAETILDLLLKDADDLIRADKGRDVAARIAYLTEATRNLSLTDDRQAIIETLAEQQQEMTIIQSDHRYASTLIDPPYAPFRPISPDPFTDVMGAVFTAIAIWGSLIFYAKPNSYAARFLAFFASRKAKAKAIKFWSEKDSKLASAS